MPGNTRHPKKVAAVMHVLFNLDNPTTCTIPQQISEAAVKAADSFVDLCLHHAAYLGGRGKLEEAIEDISKGDYYYISRIACVICMVNT